MNSYRDTDGFTLVELLVVIVIVGILAAIAIPVYFRQREAAYTSAMRSDLRNAVTAETAYSVDNGSYTVQPTDLSTQGYKTSNGVTPVHVKLVADSFVACVKHTAVTQWLVYDGTSGLVTKSSSDCA
jgi:prepilin-type N-terminal cleavage/methylation domain-containing protein